MGRSHWGRILALTWGQRTLCWPQFSYFAVFCSAVFCSADEILAHGELYCEEAFALLSEEMNERFNSMMDSRKAAEIARAYLLEFFDHVQYVQVEEVELLDDPARWLITLSYLDRESLMIPAFPPSKTYKAFEVDCENGEVRSMKIRKV